MKRLLVFIFLCFFINVFFSQTEIKVYSSKILYANDEGQWVLYKNTFDVEGLFMISDDETKLGVVIVNSSESPPKSRTRKFFIVSQKHSENTPGMEFGELIYGLRDANNKYHMLEWNNKGELNLIYKEEGLGKTVCESYSTRKPSVLNIKNISANKYGSLVSYKLPSTFAVNSSDLYSDKTNTMVKSHFNKELNIKVHLYITPIPEKFRVNGVPPPSSFFKNENIEKYLSATSKPGEKIVKYYTSTFNQKQFLVTYKEVYGAQVVSLLTYNSRTFVNVTIGTANGFGRLNSTISSIKSSIEIN